jgi:murein L,D-transpeptidase YcbB/YkuD
MLIEQERLRLEGVKIEIDKARAQQAWQRESTDAQRESANEVMAAQINLLKAELDRYKADLDASTKINIAAMSHQAAAEQAAAKAGIRPMASNGASIDDVVQAAADNTIQGLRNDQQQQMAAMLSSLQQQAEMMRGLIGAMAAPRELVRDPATGKVTGMRPVIQPPEGQIQ